MRNIRLTIEYDGTKFKGWQVQAQRNRTVQGEIEKALKKIFNKRIRLIGSGRTDSGVHALGQVANFKTASQMEASEMLRALNGNLPEDISVLEARDARDDFHSQYGAKRKTYRYTILNRKIRCSQQRYFLFQFQYKLNITKMRSASKALIGKKDFRSFMAADPAQKRSGKSKNTVRTIYKITIKKSGDLITIDIEANGFLYKMVRNIVGTLIEIGSGKRPKEEISDILRKKDRISAGDTSPAKGLCLLNVSY